MPKTVFIYALCEPGTRTVRYIGKTARLKIRLKEHLRDSIELKTHLGNWLRSLLAPPNFVVLSEVLEAEGSAEEMRYIAAARTSLGMKLVNSTDGGEGCVNPTPETRAKISARQTGVLRGPHSPEARAKMSAAKKGVPLGPQSPEVRAAKSARQRGVPRGPFSPKHCAAISAAQKGVPLSPEHCAAMSAARKGVPWSAARRAAHELRKLTKSLAK